MLCPSDAGYLLGRTYKLQVMETIELKNGQSDLVNTFYFSYIFDKVLSLKDE